MLSADVLRFVHLCVCVHMGLKHKQEENKRQKTSMCFGIKVIHRCIKFSVFSSCCRFAVSPHFAVLSSVALTGSNDGNSAFFCEPDHLLRPSSALRNPLSAPTQLFSDYSQKFSNFLTFGWYLCT